MSTLNPNTPPKPLVRLLQSAPAFAQLSTETCERIAQLTGERTLVAGEFLANEGDLGYELFVIVSGRLLLTQQSATAPETSPELLQLGSAGPGQVVGELSLLTGHPRAESMQALEPTVVLTLASADFDDLCASLPDEMATTVRWMTERLDAYQINTAIAENPHLRNLSTEARQDLAAALVRTDIQGGAVLFHEGREGDALYLILSGRMRLQRESGSADNRVIAELGKGDMLGELALLTSEPRSASAVAVRDSHLARLDKAAFDRLVARYPTELLGLFSRQLAVRLRLQNMGRKREGRPPVAIAVLPLTPNEQAGGARDFTGELVRQLSAFGPTLHLNRAVIDRIFPESQGIRSSSRRFNSDSEQVARVSERRLLAWLDDLEMIYRHVVYEADYQTGTAESTWTSRCLRQADVLLVVAGGPSDPRKSEQTMVRLTSKTLPSVKTTLVLLHAGGPGSVSFTKAWKHSMGIRAHEHIRMDARGCPDSGDVGRIARALNRQSVGLVLGGGFALGLAHIGVVDAMRDLQIPIDYVGGTSMGAIIAAACAQEFSHDQMLEVMDHGCAQALKGDYTLPIVSLLTGRKVTHALGKYLEKLDIEDLWLPYFAISASLVHARMVVHTSGSALKSVLASCRAPGMFPPLGWDGDVLVDGGLVNNIPADIMRQSVGSGTVFAADVSPRTEFTAGQEFGTDVSGWKVAARNFNPFSRQKKMGTLADVLMRLIRLGGVAHEQQIQASADLYLSVPLEKFSVRDFHRGEEMSQVAYQHAKEKLEDWIARNGRPWQGNAADSNSSM
jgi:NTE family protein/lysophospholipid hydrolase